MKRNHLITTYLAVASTLAFAQPPNPSTTTDKMPPLMGCNRPASPPITPSVGEPPVNNLPFFPGGPSALEAYMEHLDVYPSLARETQTEGAVRVRFRVQPSGDLTNIRVVQSKGPLLDQAALRAVSLMPRWYPAHQAGAAIICPAELLITFRLD